MNVHTRDFNTGDIIEITKEDRINWVLRKTVKYRDNSMNLIIDHYYEKSKNNITIQGNLWENTGEPIRRTETTSNTNQEHSVHECKSKRSLRDRIREMGHF